MEAGNMNTTALAYMGDAIYELYIRRHVIHSGQTNADLLHKMSVQFVRAEGQSMALKQIFECLSEEEQSLVKRARNRKTISKPKNVDPVIYKRATAFEALLGYLYLTEQQDRLEEIIEQAIVTIENTGAENGGQSAKKRKKDKKCT